MTRKRYIAIHTFHSDKSKEAFYAFNTENPQTDQEMLEAWTFEKCQLAATWFSDDDFFSVIGWLKATKIYIKP